MLSYLLYLAVNMAINVILASSLNIINGICGLFSLGHAGFFAVGAYSAAAFTVYGIPDLAVTNPVMALFLACGVGMAAAALMGLLVGVPCLRLTGDYLCIATIGFGEIIRILLLNMDSVGGSRGFPGIPHLSSLRLVLFFMLLSLWLLNNLIRSAFGRAILAIRDDEIAARSMGINVRFYKTFSFVVGSAFAGLAGALLAHHQEFLHPQNFYFMISVTVLLMIVVGGVGSQRGAIIGAILVTLIPEALRLLGDAAVNVFPENPTIGEKLKESRMLIFGFCMVFVMLWQPDGIMGYFEKRKHARMKAEAAV